MVNHIGLERPLSDTYGEDTLVSLTPDHLSKLLALDVADIEVTSGIRTEYWEVFVSLQYFLADLVEEAKDRGLSRDAAQVFVRDALSTRFIDSGIFPDYKQFLSHQPTAQIAEAAGVHVQEDAKVLNQLRAITNEINTTVRDFVHGEMTLTAFVEDIRVLIRNARELIFNKLPPRRSSASNALMMLCRGDISSAISDATESIRALLAEVSASGRYSFPPNRLGSN